jgi:c-di-GMP-binding flagellar brake protein YcgR
MGNKDLSDRRKYPRTPLDLEIEVSQLLSEDQQTVEGPCLCKCRDISGGGLSFYSMHSCTLQSVLRLHIPLDDLHIKVMGKVMWCKKLPTAPDYVIGVQFLNIYEQDFKILCSYVATTCL